MTTYTLERLYALLPAVHRLRDDAQGTALRSLLAVIAREIGVVEEDIDALYANWFIETSAEWVTPYIGELLGVRGLQALESAGFTRRAFVANTLGYRRRKGTATMLEQLARDTTQWNARAVEFFELLGTTQYLNHLRPHNVRTPDLRNSAALELLDTPFDRAAHTVDVRRIAAGRGRHNIPNVGIFLWRLQAYFVQRSTPRAHQAPAAGRYTFSPLGSDAPLFNRPQTETTITHLADEVNVPGPLRRRPLYDDLERYRRVLAAGKGRRITRYFDPRQPVLQVFLDQPCTGDPQADCLPLAPEQILICDLSGWDDAGWMPPPSKPAIPGDPNSLHTKVAVDPVLGRLALLKDIDPPPAKIEVSYTYGYSADLGGGPYDRRWVALPEDPAPSAYENTVAAPAGLGQLYHVSATGFDTLALALQQWAADGKPSATIQIEDSRTYTMPPAIVLPAAADLVIQAANRRRPTLFGDLTVTAAPAARLALHGLLLAGSVTIAPGDLRRLDVLHCTLVPGPALGADGEPVPPIRPSIVAAANRALTVHLAHSIAGPLLLDANSGGLYVEDCIIESPERGSANALPVIAGDAAGAKPGPVTTLLRVTVLGSVHVKELTLASEVIFSEQVVAERRQTGCVRFSYVPPAAQTPRRFRCQPELAIAAAQEEARRQAAVESLDPALAAVIVAAVTARVKPAFTSTRYGSPAYSQLSLACAAEIRTGAEDGSEMGAFCLLKQPQRIANLQFNLDEYLRFGLQAGLFFVT